jgi:hypothetical protein
MSDTPKATVEDFLMALDDTESAELSHLNLPTDLSISRPKIQFQLNLAAKEWLSWFGVTDYDEAPIECTGSAIKCEINLSRYALEYLNPREDSILRVNNCRQIARDYADDLIAKSKVTVSTDATMSIFTI